MIALLKSLFSLLRAYWPQIVMLLAVALIGYKFGHSAGQQAHQSGAAKPSPPCKRITNGRPRSSLTMSRKSASQPSSKSRL